jgi:hypothetical protein
MVNINEIPPFPNLGVRLIKEDEHVALMILIEMKGTGTEKR